MAPGQIDPGPLTDNVVCVHEATAPYGFLANVPMTAVKPRIVVAWDGAVATLPQNSGNRTTLLDETETGLLGIDQEEADAFDAPFDVNPILVMPELVFPAFTRGW